jgi:TolB-like protein/DNA-binding winged helix-turn-helix (wHTH) protein/Tfp pilus assembly protein PilF
VTSITLGEDLELDLRAYELRRGGRALRLERIPMEFLLLLVEQRGQLVTREQIVERVWGKEVFVDTDNAINGAIHKVRLALRDDPERPRFIQTVTGKGYRFIAPVLGDDSEETTGAPRPEAAVVTPGSASATAAPASTASRRWPVVLAVVAVLAALGAYLYDSRPQPAVHVTDGRIMLAVLPLDNLTGDPGQDYFSDGLTEELIGRLGNLDPERLGVIARTSVMQFKRGQKSLAWLGRELGVQYVLEGSVRRDLDRVRITAQLIEVEGQTHVWARNYDRELSGLLAVQDEIAQSVAAEIHLTLAGQERLGLSPSPALSSAKLDAYDLYLKGRYFWNKRTPQGLQQAVALFEQALDQDPTYARAFAGLADSYALMVGVDTLADPEECAAKARAAALRALELDERLAEAHAALAVLVQWYDWDWETAEREFRRAIELDPNYATGHHWYGEHLALRGRFEEAFVQMDRARELDPLSLIIATDYGVFLYFSRQHDRAIQQLRSVLEREPGFSRAYMLAYAYVQTGRFAEALALLEQWRRINDGPWASAILAYAHGRAGETDEAQRALERLEAFSRTRSSDPSPLVVAHIGMDHLEAAFVLLEDAYRNHSPGLTALKVDPTYDPLRGDPRFQDLLRRVRLEL